MWHIKYEALNKSFCGHCRVGKAHQFISPLAHEKHMGLSMVTCQPGSPTNYIKSSVPSLFKTKTNNNSKKTQNNTKPRVYTQDALPNQWNASTCSHFMLVTWQLLSCKILGQEHDPPSYYASYNISLFKF